MFIYRIMNYFSISITTICIIVFVSCLWYTIRNIVKRNFSFANLTNKVSVDLYDWFSGHEKIILVIALVLTLFVDTTVHQILGIHNLKIKPEGTYCFYVDATNSNGKHYTVPAQILIETETEEIGDKERTHTYYYVEKLFFS